MIIQNNASKYLKNNIFMKSMTTFKSVIVTIIVLLSFNIQQTFAITVDVKTAGTLSTLIPSSNMYSITTLSITGYLNGTDFRLIRQLAGNTYDGRVTYGQLSELDLSGATIISGGDTYYADLIVLDDTLCRYMFKNCTKINKIILPNSVNHIGHGAFEGCTGLKSVIIPDNITSIGDDAFRDCSSLTDITLPNSITTIGERAFLGCSKLINFTIPNSVIHIGEMAFEDCKNLVRFIVPEDHEVFSVIDSVLYNKDKSMMIRCPEGMPRGYKIREGLLSIGNDAFFGCEHLDSIVIPLGVNYVGGRSFENCTRLRYVKIPSSVISLGCSFYNCITLEETHNNNKTPQDIDMFCFEFVNKKTCKLYVPRGSKNDFMNARYWKEFENIIEENITANDYFSNKNISISSFSNGICIKTDKLINVAVFSITGQKVFSTEVQGEVNISLAKGIYIVTAGNESRKTVVR